jgi:imidazolonepropionase-like amidohydrolase
MRTLALLALLAGASGPQESRVVVIRAGRVYTGSGEVLDRATIVVEKGRITALLATGATIPEGAQVIDASNEVVIPGLVEAHSSLADAGLDAEESVSPGVRAIDGFDFYASQRRLLAGGVTTLCITPGSQRLVSGRGAVVKTAGESPAERTLAATFGMRITLGERSKNPPPLFSPPVPPSADEPLRPARRQYPVSRMGEFGAIRRAAEAGGPLREPGVPLLVEARQADDLVKAILLAGELGRPIVLLDAGEATAVADLLVERKVPVVYNPGFSPGRRDLEDASRPGLEPSGSLEKAAALSRAGVRLALHAPEDGDLSDLLFIAAAAARAGMSEKDALQAVTRVPAEILGVADRVGTIAPGRDADLVVLSGEPLASNTVVRRVLVNGSVAFERRDADVQTYRAVREPPGRGKDLLAIRGGRILTVTQGILPDGLLFVEKGKISYVGRGRPIPPEAKVVDATGLTVVPGFIDFGSHLGFHVDRTEQALRRGRLPTVPSSLAVPPSTLVRTDEPEFRSVAASGVTSILLSPDGTGVCSLIKLSGERNAVVREAAALRFRAEGGTAGGDGLKEQLQRGRKYHEEWEAWEKAKREPPPKPAAPETPAKAPDPITGTWKGALESGEPPAKADFTAELRLEGSRATGTLQAAVLGPQAEAVEGTFVNDDLKLETTRAGLKGDLTAKLSAPDQLKGTWKVSAAGRELRGTFEARRTSAAAPAAAPPKPELKEPRKDEALEPYRKLFLREIPAIVAAPSLPAVENAARVLKGDFGLDPVIVGGDDVVHAGDVLFTSGAGVCLGPDFVVERRGARINLAEALTSQGIPVVLATGGRSSTRTLPLLASYGVRNGMDPFDALKTMTINPARLLRLEARLGAVERGRDADLVLLTGDPLSLSSRVKMVLVDGKIVYEDK